MSLIIYHPKLIKEHKISGKGNFGEVWKGMKNRELVAIKILKSSKEQAKLELQKEVAIFR